MPKIYCSINNCHYYGKGNLCEANEIMITHDRMGNQMPESMDAMQSSQFEPSPAQTCMETCCKTFVPKGGRTHADGAYKTNQMEQTQKNNQFR